MRQKYYKCFALPLNNLSNGKLQPDDADLFIKSRVIRKEVLEEVSKNAIHLFCTNISVDAHNIAILDSITTEGTKSIAL